MFDDSFTFVGFIGLATPKFLLALVPMFIAFAYFDTSVGGLFSLLRSFPTIPLWMALSAALPPGVAVVRFPPTTRHP